MSTLHGNNPFSSDDDSSDSGSDSDASGNESDDHPMSEIEIDPRDRKSIGYVFISFLSTASLKTPHNPHSPRTIILITSIS